MTLPGGEGSREGSARLALAYPLLFALFPPLALYAHNQRLYRLPELALPVAATLLLTGLLFLPAALLWKDPHERAFRVFAVVFCFHLSGHAASYFGGLPVEILGRGFDLGAVSAWAVGTLGLGLLTCRLPAAGVKVTRTLALFSVVLVGMQAARIAGLEAERLARRDLDFSGGVWSVVRSVPPAEAPHIFYVVLDSYARQDVLAEHYGLDNAPFLEALRQRGFYVASRSESNYPGTVSSLTSALNMSYLDEIPRSVRLDGDLWAASRAIGQNLVARVLRTRGYSFVAFANGIGITEAGEADVFLDVDHAPAIDSKFFQTMVGLTPLRGLKLGWQVGRERIEGLHRARVLHALETAPGLAASKGPVFAFVHVVCPHGPFVFDAQGNLPPRPPSGGAEAMRAYAAQVTYLNGRVLRMVDEILAASRRPVVIVLQGDHGTNPGADWNDLDTPVGPHRMKILNAYLFPDRQYGRLSDTITPVNTFRVVLSQHLGMDIPLLPDRRSGGRANLSPP
jgi:hypothetical protein